MYDLLPILERGIKLVRFRYQMAFRSFDTLNKTELEVSVLLPTIVYISF